MIDRRKILAGAGLLATGVAFGGCAGRVAASGSAPLASTRHGRVRGFDRDGVHIFKGVRYGADTGRTGRFKLPRQPNPWDDVADARLEGPACFQRHPDMPKSEPQLAYSEDCLKLNVWTPALRDGAKRPVMVWLHGGGLWFGSAGGDYRDWAIPNNGKPGASLLTDLEGPWHEGANLARNQDVVVVAPNHRIGCLAYTFLEGVDPAFEGSGNAGFFDLIQALEWVRDNIEEFGGDPDNVTIFGQSGGGQKVSILMAMPRAKGLFHKAICMSGPNPATVGRTYATDLARRVLAKLGIAESQVAAIQQVPIDHLMRAYFAAVGEVAGAPVWGMVEGISPVAGGFGLPEQPFWYGAPEYSRDVPLLIGSTSHEMTAHELVDIDPTLAEMDWDRALREATKLFGNDAKDILAQFRQAHPAEGAWEVYSRAHAHYPTRIFSLMIADHKSAQAAAPVWVYRVDWQTPVMDGKLFAPHAIDNAFVLDNAQADAGYNGGGTAPQRMANLMSAAWASFSRTGSPQTTDLPNWPAYSERKGATMMFELSPRLVMYPDPIERTAVQAFLPNCQPAGLEPPVG